MLIANKKQSRGRRLSNGNVLPDRYVTEDEYMDLCAGIRAEWVDGKVEIMSPESVEHSDLLGWLFNLLRPLVETNELGIVLGPNVAVRLASQKRRRLPDVFFVAKSRQHIVRKNHIEGAPDLALEVVSPRSQSHDRRTKFAEYEQAAIREYWILDPLSRTMEAYTFKRGKYSKMKMTDETIHSIVLPGFHLRQKWLFRQPLPKIFDIQKELGLR